MGFELRFQGSCGEENSTGTISGQHNWNGYGGTRGRPQTPKLWTADSAFPNSVTSPVMGWQSALLSHVSREHYHPCLSAPHQPGAGSNGSGNHSNGNKNSCIFSACSVSLLPQGGGPGSPAPTPWLAAPSVPPWQPLACWPNNVDLFF